MTKTATVTATILLASGGAALLARAAQTARPTAAPRAGERHHPGAYDLRDNDPGAGGWHAPARWAKKKNPFPATAARVAAGKAIFTTNCVACHGPHGHGNGPAGAFLKPKPKDLASKQVQSKSDGTLFWKISHGNKPMPPFASKFSRRKRWELVDFIRSLAKSK